MKYFLTIILFYIAISAQVDPPKLINEAESVTGTERIDLLTKAAEIYRDLSQFPQAIECAEQALTEAGNNEYVKGKINAQNILGGTYLMAQQLKTGIDYTRQALAAAEKKDYKFGIASSYRNIGVFLIYSNRSQEAVDTLQMSVSYFEELKDTTSLAAAYTSLGVANLRINEIDKSIDLFKIAATLFDSQNNNYQAAHAFLNLASTYSTITSSYTEALRYGLKALENFQLVGDELKSAYAMSVLGTIYEDLGEYDKAMENYNKALAIFEESGNAYLLINTINNIGEVHKHKREFNEAIDYYTQALEKSKEVGNEEGIAVELNNIGECYFALDHYALALDYYNQSFSILTKLNDKHKLAISNNNQAEAHLKLNNYSKAISNGEKGIQLAKAVKSIEEEQRGYNIVYNSYSKLGNYKAALNYHIKFEEIKDSLLNEQKNTELAKALAEQDAIQKEREIELLTRNADLKEQQLDRQETLSYLLIAISLMLLVFAVVYYIRYKERRAMNQKLLQSEKELKELNKTKDLFFSIIAHDLKGPFNSLLGITEMMAEDLETFTDEEIENLSREVNNNARNVYLLLDNLLEWSTTQLGKHAFDPVKFDLNEVVTQNINLYRKAASVKEINVNVDLENDAFVYGDKNMIDSVMRNLLNNAIKFTNRTGKVNVKTMKENGSIMLTVEDNGIGISQDELDKIFKLDNDVKKPGTDNEKGTGLGLILSKEFIEKNNGKIEVRSKEGKGTNFKVTLPTPN